MEPDLPVVDIDFEVLESYLRVLCYANRLELLSTLRKPRALEEIELTPTKSQAGASPGRVITRPAVQNHLDKLVEAGLVQVGRTKRLGGRAVNEYLLDHARLFGLTEEFRKLGRLKPVRRTDVFATQALQGQAEASWVEGPKLVLVHGVGEGTVFPLTARSNGTGRGAVIGRFEGAQVSLTFDPYVSAQNAEITHRDGRFHLLDLRTSKNGTFLNWRRLPTGGESVLDSGDVIGVGHSSLVFRER